VCSEGEIHVHYFVGPRRGRLHPSGGHSLAVWVRAGDVAPI
jgi:hypothetical protein